MCVLEAWSEGLENSHVSGLRANSVRGFASVELDALMQTGRQGRAAAAAIRPNSTKIG